MKFRDDIKQKSSVDYVRLKAGESVVGVFKGDPVEFYQIYPSNDPVPQGTKGAAFRFKINFITKEGASYVAKVFSQGVVIYNRLKHLNENYDLEKTVVSITRKGATKDDTEYYIDPLPPSKQPGATGWAVINKTDLQNIDDGPETKPKDEGYAAENYFDGPPPEENESELPF